MLFRSWLKLLQQHGSPEDAATGAFFELQEGAPTFEAASARGWSHDRVRDLSPTPVPLLVDEALLRAHVQAAIAQGVLPGPG